MLVVVCSVSIQCSCELSEQSSLLSFHKWPTLQSHCSPYCVFSHCLHWTPQILLTVFTHWAPTTLSCKFRCESFSPSPSDQQWLQPYQLGHGCWNFTETFSSKSTTVWRCLLVFYPFSEGRTMGRSYLHTPHSTYFPCFSVCVGSSLMHSLTIRTAKTWPVPKEQVYIQKEARKLFRRNKNLTNPEEVTLSRLSLWRLPSVDTMFCFVLQFSSVLPLASFLLRFSFFLSCLLAHIHFLCFFYVFFMFFFFFLCFQREPN